MRLRMLHLYLLREIAVPFFLSVFVLSFVALMPELIKIAEQVLAFGISLGGLAQVITYLLPPILLFVIPASFLLAVLVAFGRLSADSEMIAVKAGGVSLWQLLAPVLALGVFASGLTAVMSSYGEPWGRYSIKQFIFNLGRTKAAGLVRERTFNDDFFGLVIYADSVSAEESRLKNVFIADERNPKQSFAVQAREGRIIADPVQRSIVLHLVDGTVDQMGDVNGPLTRLQFTKMDYNILPETTVNLPGKDPYEMFPGELYAKLRADGAKATGRQWMAFYKKFAYPISALLIGLIGMALGINDPRHGKSRGYGYGLAALLLYYLLVRIGDATGEKGTVPPEVAAWTPNVVFAALGIWLFIAKAGERDTFIERIWARISR
jgi:lipopolysaccharide export system permease protein